MSVPGSAPGTTASAGNSSGDEDRVIAETLLNAAPKNVVKAEKKLRNNLFDTDSWTVVLLHFQTQSIARSREVFDSFLQVFPTAAHYWKFYIEKEIEANNLVRVEQLFERCLPLCPDVELYRTYMRYMRLVKTNQPGEREAICSAFDFALKNVGLDFNSSQIWIDYIEYVKMQNVRNPHEDAEKTKLIRSIYHQSVVVPLSFTEILWKQYDQWEHSLHKELAQGILAVQAPLHTKTVSVKREIKRKREGLLQHMLARPPVDGVHAQTRDYKQCLLWKQLLELEKSNPLRLEAPAHRARVVFTYRQALLTLRHYPEIWQDFAAYFAGLQLNEEAKKIYEEAVVAMPDSEIMPFLYADFHERLRNFKEARAVYDELIKRRPSALALIEQLRFSRRCEGPDAARKTFISAIKHSACTYHVYISAALLEYHVNSEPKFAVNIFNRGIKLFEKNSDFILAYLDFLESRNDRQNMLVIFEKAFRDIAAKDAKPIWDRFVSFQCMSGDLEAMELAEKRRAEALRSLDDPQQQQQQSAKVSIQAVIHRKHFMDLWPCSKPYRETLSLSKALNRRANARRVRNELADSARELPRPDVSKLRKLLCGTSVPLRAPDAVPLRMPPSTPMVLQQILRRLPRPNPHRVHVEKLIKFIRLAKAEFPVAKTEVKEDVATEPTSVSRKRDSSAIATAPPLQTQASRPVRDVFRMRQAQKMAKLQ